MSPLDRFLTLALAAVQILFIIIVIVSVVSGVAPAITLLFAALVAIPLVIHLDTVLAALRPAGGRDA